MTDPFSGLPSELQLEILFQLDSTEDCEALSRASSVMWLQIRHSRHILDKVFLCQDFSPRLLHVATAIVRFPKYDETKIWRRLEQIDQYLKSWAAGSLPDPFAKENDESLAQIIQLWRRIRVLAQDYLMKATSKSQVYPYRLPDSDATEITGVFDMRELKSTEKERLFSAFLRYELLCRIYQPESKHYDYRSHAHYPRGVPFLLHEWYWGVLDSYEDCVSAPWEREALLCVHEYMCSLYIAMVPSYMSTQACQPPVCLGKCSSWLECTIPHPELASSGDGQTAPTIDLKRGCPALRLYANGLHRPDAITALAVSGLRRLYKSFAGVREGKRLNFKTLAKKRFDVYPMHVAEMNAAVVTLAVSEEDWAHGPSAWRDYHSEFSYEKARYSASKRLCLGILRQRAWVIFEDGRLYANNCFGRLPSKEDMNGLQTRSYPTEMKGLQTRCTTVDCFYCRFPEETEDYTYFPNSDIKKLRSCFWSIPPEDRFFYD
ncbi:hypothetical protein F5Y18DRAFT_160239 [Xylariaceae sp. FL1019]|nr:hypothetical protein F5Y18DRAFT_160239 [Xylariaceae sp. FL1019]